MADDKKNGLRARPHIPLTQCSGITDIMHCASSKQRKYTPDSVWIETGPRLLLVGHESYEDDTVEELNSE